MLQESTVRNRLRIAFKRLYPTGVMVCIEGSSGQAKGLPDRLFMAAGRSVWVEVKTEAGRVSALQWRQMERLAECGQRVILLWGHDDRVRLEHVPAGSAVATTDPERVWGWSDIQTEQFWDALFGRKE